VIRVLIAEDHALVRAGLIDLLTNRPDVEVVGEAADGEQAVARAAELRPDVVLMDLSMPHVDGIEATRRIGHEAPGTNVVVLTSFSDRERILQALDAGAVGYLLKDLEPDELHRGILAAARGESPLAPKAAHAVISARAQARPSIELSAREREVLGLVADGLPNKLIARQLEISEKTVKAHLTKIFHAIGVTDRTQAALWAHRNGHV
jgi:DNA-binding NarL/FixJ family response regulator